MQPERKHLFVCGCARSGTTALWKLLVSHPAIVLGLERYILKTGRGEPMTPDLFLKERFFGLRPREALVDDLAKVPFYVTARTRFDRAIYVGDKQPGLYRGLNAIEANFADATVICIVRNIIDVAGSFQKRAEKMQGSAWKPTRDHARAVSEWRHCMTEILALGDRTDRRTRLIVISYEDLFMSDANVVALFEALDLDVPMEVLAAYRDLRRSAPALEAKRGDGLTSQQRNTIALTAPFDLYRQVHAGRLTLIDAAPDA